MIFIENINLSFWSVTMTVILATIFVFVIWGIQKFKSSNIAVKVFSEHTTLYMARSLQIATIIWFVILAGSNVGFHIADFLKRPIINTENFRISPYIFIIIYSELLLIILIRQIILHIVAWWHNKKQLKASQMRMLLIILELLIWGSGVLIFLFAMKIPVKTMFGFSLITFSTNKTLTVGNIISILLIFSLTNWVLSVLQEIFLNIGDNDSASRPRRKTLFTIVKYLLWVIIIILSLETLGVKISVLIASSAALFVGIGLGLQEIFKDLISGIFLHFEKNLREGDIIESKGIVGEVKELGIRTTRIRTRDNIFMMVPNHQFITEPVINWSHSTANTRFSVEVGVAYGSDVGLVEKILLDCAIEHKLIVHNPKPFVRFLNFGNSSLDFQLFFWTENTFVVENIKSDIRFYIYKAFADNNISIPFPQQDVYIKEINKKDSTS